MQHLILAGLAEVLREGGFLLVVREFGLLIIISSSFSPAPARPRFRKLKLKNWTPNTAPKTPIFKGNPTSSKIKLNAP
jgi:hypothetical protein